jgi:hypothetical protein
VDARETFLFSGQLLGVEGRSCFHRANHGARGVLAVSGARAEISQPGLVGFGLRDVVILFTRSLPIIESFKLRTESSLSLSPCMVASSLDRFMGRLLMMVLIHTRCQSALVVLASSSAVSCVGGVG